MNFEQLDARYRELLARRKAGVLDAQKFEELASALRTQDAAQQWWQIDPESGRWLKWDGAQWQAAEPSREKSVGQPPPPSTGLSSPVSNSAATSAMHSALDFLQNLWRRFLARMISPAEFLRQGRLPLAQRSQGWWDVLAVAGGTLSGYIWFLYSSIRGMPHFTLIGLSGGRDVWYDFIPSLLLAALPFVLVAFRGKVMDRLQQLWTRINTSISYAMQLGAGLILGAILLNYLSPSLLGWAFTFREGLDFTTPLLMVGIPVALALFRPETDQLIAPLQPVRQSVPRFLLVGVALAVPYALGFVLYRLSFNQYELLHWNLALGILIPYVLLRNPPPVTLAAAEGGVRMLLALLLPMGLLVASLIVPEARADDCARDIFNLRDCLRTGGYAESMSGTAASVVSVLVNGSELVRIFLQPPTAPPQEAPASAPSPSSGGDAVLGDPRAEIDRVNTQWKEASTGVDPNDPGYDKLKKQYDDYRQWLEGKVAADDAARAAAEAEALTAEAAARETAARQAEWIRQREEDLKQVRENSAFIAATAAGAKQAGFDTAEHDQRLRDLQTRDRELSRQITASGGDTGYRANQRDVIPVGEGFKEAIRLAEEQKRQAAIAAARVRLDDLQKKQFETERDYWKTVKSGFWGGVTSDVDAIPGQLKDAAKAGLKTIGETVRDAKDAISDANNWKALGQAVVQTGKDLVGSPLQSARKVAGFYGEVAGTAAKVGVHIVTHPVETVKAIAGVDNWEKAMDPNVPVTERIGRVLVGIADAAVNISGAGLVGKGAKVADKVSGVVRSADKIVDGVRAADKASDAAKTLRAGDAAVDARKAGRAGEVAIAPRGVKATEAVPELAAQAAKDRAAAAEAKKRSDAYFKADAEAAAARKKAWDEAQAFGRSKVDEFDAARREAKTAAKSGDEAAKVASKERLRKATLEVQGDKQALWDINKKDRSDVLKKEFNKEMETIYKKTDKQVVEELCKKNGINPDALREHPPGSGIFYNELTGRPDVVVVKPTNLKAGVSVGADRDVTVRVRQYGDQLVADPENPGQFIRAGDKGVLADVPSKDLAPIYNEAFHKAAGADKSISAEEFAHTMDQVATDRRHAEAYGRGQKDLAVAISKPGDAFSDVAQVSKAAQYKSEHLYDQAHKLAAEGRFQEAETAMGEGMRQTTKQFDRQVMGRAEALAAQGVDVTIPQRLQGDIAIMKKAQTDGWSPAQIANELKARGTTVELVTQQSAGLLESMQKLRPR